MYSKINPPCSQPGAQHGYSLLELAVVVLILGIMAAVVIPDYSTTSPAKLELAAQQVAQALRFARAESLRSGEYFGVTISQITQNIVVKKWNMSTDPVSTELVPYHPVSKKGFEFKVDGLTFTQNIVISNSSDIFLYNFIGRRRSLIFNPQGAPMWMLGADDSVYRLLDGVVTLSDGQNQREIAVAPITGRVTVQ